MTIYDIAEIAGVSASTVSRVVNKRPGVRPEIRKEIQKLLLKYNYSPNETARGLVTQTSRIIGILVSDIRNIHHTDGAYIIERALANLGYSCIIFNTGSDEKSKEKYIQIISQRRVEGAVLIGSTFQSETVLESIRRYLSTIPVFISNGYVDLPNVYGVLADEYGGVGNCVDMLYEKGRTHIAFVMGNNTPSNRLKLSGYKDAVRRHGGEPQVFDSENTLKDAYAATLGMISADNKIDGIIYSVDLLAAGGVRALYDLKIAVPKQVAVIGIDNSLYCEICNPKLTSLDNKLLDVNGTIARSIINVLEGRMVTKKMMIFSDIVQRETT